MITEPFGHGKIASDNCLLSDLCKLQFTSSQDYQGRTAAERPPLVLQLMVGALGASK
jgi:hypothetical protein